MPKRRNLKFFIFSAIGVFNTLFDLVLYVVLYNLTSSIVIANIVATSAALIGSYFLNSRLTFKAHRWTKASFVGFAAVTLFGLWILQTGIIYVITPLLDRAPGSFWHLFGSFEQSLRTVLPKLIATAVTFVWNFIWYNKVIFKDLSVSEQERIAADTL